MTAISTDTSQCDSLLDVPKLDLHVHLIGCVRPATLRELAGRAGVTLPRSADDLYRRINSMPTPAEEQDGPWYPLLRVYELICRCLKSEDDFARIVYETLEDGLRSSNVVYQELAFSPTVHMALGTPYPVAIRGLVAGIKAARADLGVDAGLIMAVNREDTPGAAVEMVQSILRSRVDEVVAIGLDFDESKGPPEAFARAFSIARQAELHLTAHAGEHVPGGQNVRYCLDQLGCERIDHGYFVLDDDDLVERCRAEQVVFNVAFTTSRRKLRAWRRSSVRKMVDRGLRISINSDDPQLFPTTITDEIKIAVTDVGLTEQQVIATIRNSIDASFLAPEAKHELHNRVTATAGEASNIP